MISDEIKTKAPKVGNHIYKNIYIPLISGDHSVNIEKIINAFPIICNDLKSEDIKQTCYSIYALKQILKITLAYTDILKEFLDYLLNSEFLSFLFQILTNDLVHPFFLKNSLKILEIIIVCCPQVIDELLEYNIHNILVSTLPNKNTTKCITKMIELNENYRVFLIQSFFHKQILQMIENLSQMHSDLRYFYENIYVSILIALQQFIQFDDSDYELFLKFFIRNFRVCNELQTKSQYMYIKFMLESPDQELMFRFVNHPQNIIYNLLENFGKPAYASVIDKVLEYFIQIIESSNDYAAFFTSPNIVKLVNHMFLREDHIESIAKFIFAICASSFENCQNFINKEIFEEINFHFTNGAYEDKYSLYMVFNLLLRYPLNSSYALFFSDPQLFDAQLFFEFGDTIIQNETEGEMDVLALYHIIIDYIIDKQEHNFLGYASQHMTSTDFCVMIQECFNYKDDEFANSAKALYQKIEDNF